MASVKITDEALNEELSYVLVKELGLPVFVEILKLIEKGVFINATLRDKNTYTKELLQVLDTLESLLNFYHLQEAKNICLYLQEELKEEIFSTAINLEKRNSVEEYLLRLKKEVYRFMENALVSHKKKSNNKRTNF